MAIELIRRSYEPPLLHGDAEQSAAISHRGTPLIIRGSAGSGKTRTLIEAAYSRIHDGQDPDSILLITFGRESASELRDEVALRTQATMREPLARTFHALAFSILKMDRGPDSIDPVLLSGPEQESFIRDLIDGTLEREAERGEKFWPEELRKALPAAGFVREVRDLILRSNERGIGYAQLYELGKSFAEPFWCSIARFWQEYEEVTIMREEGSAYAKRRFDPTEIVTEAIALLERDSKLLETLRARFKTIIIDEFQESDPMQRRLLNLLASDDIVIAVDAASAVGRFRGADPDGVEGALETYRDRGKEITLKNMYRQPDAPELHLFRSENEEAQFIAHTFKREHLMNGTSYSEMAVVVRSPGSIASALRRAFIQVGIPVAGYLDVLGKNPSLAPFLLLAQVATGDKALTVDVAERLLLAEFGGADSISIRRIRRSLLLNKKSDDERTGNQLFIDALDKGEIFIEEKSALVRVHELLDIARRAARKKGATAESVLGAIWDNAVNSRNEKIAQAWRSAALKNSARSVAADRDLDAMIQLFEEAARFSERMPGAKPALFLRQISQEQIAADVITSKAARPEAVEIVTVHAAKGRQWQLVAIAGVQDGIWPNLKQRSSLLGAEKLVEHIRYPNYAKEELRKVSAEGLAKDEARLFHVALTRATQRMLVTSVSDEELIPSHYFEDLLPIEPLGDSSSEVKQGQEGVSSTPTEPGDFSNLTQAGVSSTPTQTGISFTLPERQLSLPALVAELRRTVQSPPLSEADQRYHLAASLLKSLAEAGVEIARPENWHGFNSLSTQEPIIPAGELVPVSPSGGETFEECGLKWFLERQGGTNGETTAQLLGTVIHEFARIKAQQPAIETSELYTQMEKAWKVIDSNTGWLAQSGLDNAIAMIDRFIAYHDKNLAKRTIVDVESPFELQVGRAFIRGTADRVEVNSDGELFIIDFKTGSTAVAEKDIEENLQLAAYQLAALLGKYRFQKNQDGVKQDDNKALASESSEVIVSGAELAYLALPLKSGITIRPQSSLTEEKREEVSQRLDDLANAMGGATFIARVGSKCRNCGVASSCPLQSEGRTVISS